MAQRGDNLGHGAQFLAQGPLQPYRVGRGVDDEHGIPAEESTVGISHRQVRPTACLGPMPQCVEPPDTRRLLTRQDLSRGRQV